MTTPLKALQLADNLAAQMADRQRGRRLRELREGRHWTQPVVVQALEDLAEQKDWPFKKRRGKTLTHRCVSISGYQKWEATGGVTWEHVKLIAELYDEPAEWLWDSEEAAEARQEPILNVLRGEGEVYVEDDRLDRIEAQLDKIERTLTGRENLDVRFDALDQALAKLTAGAPKRQRSRGKRPAAGP